MKSAWMLIAVAGLAIVPGGLVAAQESGSSLTPSTPLSNSPTWEALSQLFGGTAAATKPCRDAQMSFNFSTEVEKVPVHGGQRVKRGDLLIKAKDVEVVAAIEQQQVLAENELEIKGAEAQLELANIRFENLKKSGQFSPEEYDQRRIEAQTALLQRDQAKFNKRQQELRLKQLVAQAERYYLTAPFDGIIDEVMVDVGHGVTEQEKVLRIVNTDRIWLDPAPPTTETLELSLKPDSPAWILVDLPGKPVVVQGKVIEVAAVADSVSLRRRVRVEIENKSAWPAGTQAMVRFTAPPSAGEGKWTLVPHNQPVIRGESNQRSFGGYAEASAAPGTKQGEYIHLDYEVELGTFTDSPAR